LPFAHSPNRKPEDTMPRQRSLPAPPPEPEADGAPDAPELSNAEFKRMLGNGFKFWVMCRARRCQRVRGCAGEPVACFARFWAIVPEDFKLRCHTIVEGRLQGMSPEDAIAYADNKLAQFKAIEAQFAAAGGTAASAEAQVERDDVAPQRDDAPSTPRLRSMG
jgi:hypothetical protein